MSRHSLSSSINSSVDKQLNLLTIEHARTLLALKQEYEKNMIQLRETHRKHLQIVQEESKKKDYNNGKYHRRIK